MYDCVCVCTCVRVCVCTCARFPHNHWPPGSHGLDLEVFVNFVLSCEGERLPWAQPRGPSPSTSQATGFPTCRCFFPAALSLSCSFPPGPQSVPNSRGSTPRPGDPTGGDWPGDRCCGAHSGDPDQGSGRESAGEARPSEKGAVAPGSQDDCDQPPSGGHRPGSAESCRCHSQSRQKWGQGVPRGSRSPSFAKESRKPGFPGRTPAAQGGGSTEVCGWTDAGSTHGDSPTPSTPTLCSPHPYTTLHFWAGLLSARPPQTPRSAPPPSQPP